jgi:hypothetical protein
MNISPLVNGSLGELLFNDTLGQGTRLQGLSKMEVVYRSFRNCCTSVSKGGGKGMRQLMLR